MGDLQRKEESLVYVKVPINIENIRLSHDSEYQMTYQGDNTIQCPIKVSASMKEDQEKRHAHLMKLIDIHGQYINYIVMIYVPSGQ